MSAAGRWAPYHPDGPGDAAAVAVVDALREALRAVRLADARAVAAGGLPPTQRRALAAVAARPGVGVVALAQALHVDPSTASVVVGQLVAGGLVARDEASGDRRRATLRPTAAGAAAVATPGAGPEAALARAVAALDPAEAAALAAGLAALARALAADGKG